MLTPPAPFRLRPMRLSDVDTVLEIERLSFPTPSKAILYRRELTENPLAHYQVVTVAKAGRPEKVVGHAGYWLIAGEIHVMTVATHPNWRGRGLGELLLLNILFTACDEAAEMVTLEVRRSNHVAQALYHKYGFELVGERRRYYRDTGEDALLLNLSGLDAGYRGLLEQKREALFIRLRSEA